MHADGLQRLSLVPFGWRSDRIDLKAMRNDLEPDSARMFIASVTGVKRDSCNNKPTHGEIVIQ
jgi:hypothetical protein